MSTRPQRRSRFVHNSSNESVDAAQTLAQNGRRLENGKDSCGTPYYRLVIPTPTAKNAEAFINLGFLCVLPRLGEALADAIFETCATVNVSTAAGNAKMIRWGFVRFLKDTGRMTIGAERSQY